MFIIVVPKRKQNVLNHIFVRKNWIGSYHHSSNQFLCLNDWLEPMQKWLKKAQNLDGIARDNNLFSKKVVAKEIFGSNLRLSEKTLHACAPKSQNSLAIPPENPWHALRAFRLGSHSKPFSSFKGAELVITRIYRESNLCTKSIPDTDV